MQGMKTIKSEQEVAFQKKEVMDQTDALYRPYSQ